MSDIEATSRIKIPKKVVPESLVRGVYANNIQQFSTPYETVIDFTVVLPAQYETVEGNRLDSVELINQVVARVVLPPGQFVDFVKSVIANNRDLFSDPTASACEGGQDDERVSNDGE